MAAQPNIVTDVNNLLKIPTKVSNELVSKACLCIGSAISDAKAQGETQITVGVGIGYLSINLLDMQCKFIPNKELKTAIKKSLDSPIDPLELILEQSFMDKLLVLCAEVL
jgi:hypothetical protein